MTQLDHLHDDASKSVGALLAHIAVVERAYHRLTFEERAPTAEETAADRFGGCAPASPALSTRDSRALTRANATESCDDGWRSQHATRRPPLVPLGNQGAL